MDCDVCEGSGVIFRYLGEGDTSEEPCNQCDGTGRVDVPDCRECQGHGSIPFLADGQWTDSVCEECGGTGEVKPEPADHPRMF